MFGKIKDKLKNVFSKNEEIIEEEPLTQELNQEEKEEVIEEKQKKQDKKEEKEQKSENIKTKTTKTKTQTQKEVIESIEDDNDKLDEVDVPTEKQEEKEEKQEKKGFFSKIFKRKEEKDEEELDQLENTMLEGAPIEEIEAIKTGKDIPKQTQIQNKKELEQKLNEEEFHEKEELQEIQLEKKVELEEINEDKLESKDEVKTEGFLSKTFSKLKAKKLTIDDFDKIWIELEVFLLEINIAYEIVEKIENSLREALIDNSFDRFSLSKKIREILVKEVTLVLEKREDNLLDKIRKINESGEVCKILVLGVNGTGKTTTIAKIVHLFQEENISVVVAAADTFRAAAVEQLGEHAKKLNFKLIQHAGGSDPAAVAYDAIEHAKARKINVALIDTAGRMPNNSNLMQELNKIERVSKSDINLFIGDSISGNDLMEQIELFDKIVGIDGMILTKTDTDERPGSIVTAAYSIEKPIYYLGIGQNYDDLVKFDAEIVADKLFEIEEDN